MSVQTQPVRPSVWLFGAAGGVQVWSVEGDARILVSVLIGHGGPIVLLNRLVAGSVGEHDALAWAFVRIADAVSGFYVCRAAA